MNEKWDTVFCIDCHKQSPPEEMNHWNGTYICGGCTDDMIEAGQVPCAPIL